MPLPEKAPEQKFEGWTILEIMGHRRLGGYVRECEIAGGAFLRIDIPKSATTGDEESEATQFYAATSIYCITPVTEVMARAVAMRNKPQPVQRWELPAPAPERNRMETSGLLCLCTCGHHENEHDDATGECRLGFDCGCQNFREAE